MTLPVRLRVSLLGSLLLLNACGGGTSTAPVKASLVTVTAIPAGATCQYGGVTLASGIDTDSSGVLEAAEVVTTTPVCNGPQADPKSLVKVSMLAFGSTLCPTGGSQIDSGLDNGDGAGMAGNGILEAGEIDGTTSICNGQAAGAFDLTKPSGAVGTAKINLNGGGRTGPIGVAGPSGAGGKLTLGGGTRPGSYAVFETGVADTTHTVPTLTPSLGTDGETISANTTIGEIAVAPVDNALYIDNANSPVRFVRYHATPTPRYTAITGIKVNAGVTLTLRQAQPAETIVLNGDLEVQGTLTSQLSLIGNLHNPLSLSARNVLVGTMGSITLTPPAGGIVGTPGSLKLRATGTISNAGTLSTAAAFHIGAVASPGGALSVVASAVYNTGTITSAAEITQNAGAAGGDIDLSADHALVNDGTIISSGGGGASGGKAGKVALGLYTPTQQLGKETLFSTGAIKAIGGYCVTNGQTAGAGGAIQIFAINAHIRHSGALSATGGAPRVAAGIVTAGDCAAGKGGSIDFTATISDLGWDTASMIDVSGPIDASGPSGSRGGGEGGTLSVVANRPQGALARLLGYASIEANGGEFGDVGAEGGVIQHVTDVTSNTPFFAPFVPEQLHIYPPINVVGGGAIVGGPGGQIVSRYVTSGAISNVSALSSPSIILAGAIDAHGGAGGLSRGGGGKLALQGFGDIELRAPIDLGGGSSAAANPTPAGILTLSTTGNALVNAAIKLNGTDQAMIYPSSRGGQVLVYAQHVDVPATGSISAHGGTSAGSRPGEGGSISLNSRGTATTVTGMLDVAAGTGPGGIATNYDVLPGTIVIDGVPK